MPDNLRRDGIPFSLNEAKVIAHTHRMDPLHRELMLWLIGEVDRHERGLGHVPQHLLHVLPPQEEPSCQS